MKIKAWNFSYPRQNSQFVSGYYWLSIRHKVHKRQSDTFKKCYDRNQVALQVVHLTNHQKSCGSHHRRMWQKSEEVTRKGIPRDYPGDPVWQQPKCLSMSKDLTFTERFPKIWHNLPLPELSFRCAVWLSFVSCCSPSWSGLFHPTSEVNCM